MSGQFTHKGTTHVFIAIHKVASVFTPRTYALAGLSDCFCPSVCPSVCLSVTKQRYSDI